MLPDPHDLPSAPPPDAACAEARRLRLEAEGCIEVLRDARRELADATRLLDAAGLDADRHRIAERKAAAALAWREAMAAAPDDDGRREATADWMRAVSELNRRTRLAMRQLAAGRHRVALLEATVAQADLGAAAARIRAEVAEDACAGARSRRAAIEDRYAVVASDADARHGGPDAAVVVDGPAQEAAAGDDVAVERGAPVRPAAESETLRLVLAGDAETHRAIAGELAEMSGSMPARYLLLLDTLVDELTGAAVDAGELAFDHDHPFWGQFTADEARLITRGLRDLGFRLDLHEGWYGGRAPRASDLASALGFAGRDLRGLRGVPSAAELRALPRSVLVAPQDHLRHLAPDLTLDQMARALGPRAARLGELWDEWGRVRPLLAGGVPTTV